ncbi:SIR2 family protein, partial [Streptomyces scabiei]
YTKYNKQLIKMHGDFDHDNFVLKENDYLNYSNNFRLIENYVKAIVGSKVVLFVGYSFNDPDLKQIFNWIKSILGKDMRR